MPVHDRKHPRRLDADQYRVPGRITFVTMVAAAGTELATPERLAVITDAMGRIGALKRVQVMAYCLMPNHLHVVAAVADEGGDLAAWSRYVKRSVANHLGRKGMWLRSYWDREARADQDLTTMVQYTLDNPVRAGLCAAWDDWPYSWSRWHEGGRGPHPNQREGAGAE